MPPLSSLRRTKNDEPFREHCEKSAAVDLAARPSGIQRIPTMPGSRRVFDSGEIRRVFAALCADRAMGTLRVEEGGSGWHKGSLCVEVVQLAPGPKLLVSAGLPKRAWERSWHVELQGQFAVVRFVLDRAARQRNGTFELPTEVERLFRRSERRVTAPASSKIRFVRADAPDEWVERPLRDIGFHGVRFDASVDDCFYPGESFLWSEITWKHGVSIPVNASVRHVSHDSYSGGLTCGATLEPLNLALSDQWNEEISGLLHPQTTLAESTSSNRLWQLYEESGYFGLDGRTARDFVSVKPAFQNAFGKLTRQSRLGCCVLHESHGRAEAAISLLRVWSGAWLAFQGARRQGDSPLKLSGNAVLRDIFLHGHETIQQDPGLQWNVSFVRADARFTRLSNYEFIKSRQPDDAAAIVPFRALEVSSRRRVLIERNSEVEVGRATQNETLVLIGALEARFPRPYLQAYDFVLGRLDLAQVRPIWASANLRRERAVFVARYLGRPMAAAIVDLVEPGIHLVGLLDSVHLVALNKHGVRYFANLIDAAQQFFSERGWGRFVLYEETGDASYTAPFEVRDLGAADQLFISASLTPEFLEHVVSITAPQHSFDAS